MTTKFGIIGLGKISSRFAKVLNTASGMALSAVASRDPERTRQFAQQFGAAKAAQSYLDVINDPEVDIIYIGLTHNFHYELTKMCLEQHKAVLCEKPFVTNRHDAEELVELASANNTLLMEAMWTRCMPAFRTARAWVQEGRIGQPKLISAGFSYQGNYDPQNRLFNPELAGGSLFDVGIYPIDFATGILAELPVSMSGEAIIAPTGVDTAAAFSLKFASGALASLTSGFNVNALYANIYGTQGSIVLPNTSGPQWAELRDVDGETQERFEEPVADGFIYQILHVAELYQQGRIESDLIPWADTIASAGIFDDLLGQFGKKES
ncbi:scyllo-inositol 2-dehydrogenase (NADP(+)) IolU [bioreactor metagenome]|uniref:Scyllo-inositol 2-dehydrogenase (NADP(+)) IolU n=1 Tax=bioreactor metagenome TaxID=1076179 RepID=A0A645ARZ4_9ZZZZ